MNNQHYISSLQELYEHPDNGKPDTYIAAFLSADKTYPIFVTTVTRVAAGGYIAYGIGYKWGYDSPDTMPVTWWGDSGMQRDVHHQFFFWYNVMDKLMPLAIQAQCRFLPLQTYSLTYMKQLEVSTEDDPWIYSAIAVAISERHAVWQLRDADGDAVNIEATHLNYPQILTDVWSD